MEQIKLVIPQYISITRSYSSKFNPENHGIEGRRFETEDFFASYGEQVPVEEATNERLAEVSARLFERAKSDVELAIINRANFLKGGSAPVTPSTEDLEKIAPFVARIVAGEDLDKIEADIIKVKNVLSDNQKDMLRSIMLKKKNKVE